MQLAQPICTSRHIIAEYSSGFLLGNEKLQATTICSPIVFASYHIDSWSRGSKISVLVLWGTPCVDLNTAPAPARIRAAMPRQSRGAFTDRLLCMSSAFDTPLCRDHIFFTENTYCCSREWKSPNYRVCYIRSSTVIVRYSVSIYDQKLMVYLPTLHDFLQLIRSQVHGFKMV